ncbi:MAG: hypothetical protein WCO65_01470 [bacterium]
MNTKYKDEENTLIAKKNLRVTIIFGVAAILFSVAAFMGITGRDIYIIYQGNTSPGITATPVQEIPSSPVGYYQPNPIVNSEDNNLDAVEEKLQPDKLDKTEPTKIPTGRISNTTNTKSLDEQMKELILTGENQLKEQEAHLKTSKELLASMPVIPVTSH